MQHIRQTTNRNCGQTCVAMLASLAHRVTILPSTVGHHMGTQGKTTWGHIRRGLKAYGVIFRSLQRSRKVKRNAWGEYTVVRVYYSRKPHRSHFVVISPSGVVHDPSEKKAMSYAEWSLNLEKHKGWIATYMVVS